jgi:hypothetical protein
LDALIADVRGNAAIQSDAQLQILQPLVAILQKTVQYDGGVFAKKFNPLSQALVLLLDTTKRGAEYKV